MRHEMLALLVPLLVTTGVAILGWFVANRLSVRRDRINKRRDLRVQYLIEAYRRLENASNRNLLPEEHGRALESAIADIQLFGSPAQIELAIRFARGFAQSKNESLDNLLAELRSDLRNELALESVPGHPVVLRLVIPPKEDPS